MVDNMIYKIRVMILETYVRITMIAYESKQNALNARSPSRQFFQGRS